MLANNPVRPIMKTLFRQKKKATEMEACPGSGFPLDTRLANLTTAVVMLARDCRRHAWELVVRPVELP